MLVVARALAFDGDDVTQTGPVHLAPRFVGALDNVASFHPEPNRPRRRRHLENDNVPTNPVGARPRHLCR
jgi:hypothetical protein